MTADEFNELTDNILSQCKLTLSQKAHEYADADRLSNFKKSAMVANNTPEQALMGFRLKHEVALNDFVKWHSEGEAVPLEYIREKIVDLINYNLLLFALMKESIYERDSNHFLEKGE
jgi:hypothetical protein